MFKNVAVGGIFALSKYLKRILHIIVEKNKKIDYILSNDKIQK